MAGTLSIDLRPKTFDEVVGNRPVVSAVRSQLESGRQPIAWLFAGAPGTGKTTMAEILSRELSFPDDVYEKNGASFGVDDARELVADIAYRTFSGRRRTIIINEMQDATAAAQEELLVSFEKSTTTVFVLTTTNPNKIVKALRDRCLHFVMSGLSRAETSTLVNRAALLVGLVMDQHDIVVALDTAGINAPREIVMVIERLAAGLSINEAVQNLDTEGTEYFEIAKAVACGDWRSTAEALAKIKPNESLAVRGVVASYLKTMLLKNSDKSDALAECIRAAFVYVTPFQDGTAAAGTAAWLYGCCKRLQ